MPDNAIAHPAYGYGLRVTHPAYGLSLIQPTHPAYRYDLRVKQLRKEKGWTQKELANQLGTSYAQLNKYESGLNTPPLDRLMLLAEVLHTSIDYLIGGHKSEELPIYHECSHISATQELIEPSELT